MTPIEHFESIWYRCSQLSAIHAYISRNVSTAIDPNEILRAEWVARLSALDLYVHETVAQRMLEIFYGLRPPTDGYLKFKLSNETVSRIRAAATQSDAGSAFDLDVRTQLSRTTYQNPDVIADGIRLCSTIELWNEIAIKFGAANANRSAEAKTIKKNLSLLVERRNKIAHEGDLTPTLPRDPWPILQSDLRYVEDYIAKIVKAIDAII